MPLRRDTFIDETHRMRLRVKRPVKTNSHALA
jgi:hypothetical protein